MPLTGGGGNLGGEFGVGLVERGPAQFVEDAGTQGGGEQRHDVVLLQEAHGLGATSAATARNAESLLKAVYSPGRPRVAAYSSAQAVSHSRRIAERTGCAASFAMPASSSR